MRDIWQDLDETPGGVPHQAVRPRFKMTIGSGHRRGCGGVGCAEDDNRKWPATWLWWCWFVRKMTIGSSQRGGWDAEILHHLRARNVVSAVRRGRFSIRPDAP